MNCWSFRCWAVIYNSLAEQITAIGSQLYWVVGSIGFGVPVKPTCCANPLSKAIAGRSSVTEPKPEHLYRVGFSHLSAGLEVGLELVADRLDELCDFGDFGGLFLVGSGQLIDLFGEYPRLIACVVRHRSDLLGAGCLLVGRIGDLGDPVVDLADSFDDPVEVLDGVVDLFEPVVDALVGLLDALGGLFRVGFYPPGHLLDVDGLFLGFLGQRFDLVGDDRKAVAGLARAGGLNRGVECQQVGLIGNKLREMGS